jgi:ribose transport system ATP-binding protein
MSIDAALDIVGLSKHFAATVALESVSFSVRRGQIHALLGENGAGKSTLVKILSGLVRPDGGAIAVFGEAVTITGPRRAHDLGIRTAFQEISMVKDLTVVQNFLLMEEPTGPLGMIRGRRAEAAVKDSLERFGLGYVDPRATIRELDLPTRQKLEITRAISRHPRILLLDEPTASLLSTDVQWLGERIDDLKKADTTIIFISHRMQEVRRFCSELTILRNGQAVGTFGVEDIDDDGVFRLMIGRSIAAAFPAKPVRTRPRARAAPALAARDLHTATGLNGVSFDLWPGQILGLGGLYGMGHRELFLALFGVSEISAGEITADGIPIRLRSPADAIRAEIGISLVPEDRKTEGLFLDLDGCRNISISSQGRFETAGLMNVAAEQRAVQEVLELVQVPDRALWSPVKNFSGGNQQKIVLAKWLLTGSSVLLLYDPTRGVDVGAKAEIYRLVRRFTEDGGAVLFYSTDIPELVNLSDDVLILYRGAVSELLHGEQISDARIMRAAVGTPSPHLTKR